MKKYGILFIALWTLLIAALIGWNLRQVRTNIQDQALIQARAIWDHNLSYRKWVTSMGGVYVRRDRMTPNPYLTISDRDKKTVDGVELTMANPAYMTSQVFDIIKQESKLPIINRIVSDKYLNPRNRPDAWEEQGLLEFQHKIKEVHEVILLNGQPYMRVFKPMMTAEGCLKCHGRQGYKVGDIRGGISVAVPMQPYYTVETRERKHIFAGFLMLWTIGAGGIVVVMRDLGRRQHQKEAGEARLDLALDAANEAWWEWDFKTGKTIYSPRFYRMLGYGPNEFPAHYDEWGKRVHPDDSDRVTKFIHDHLVEQKTDYHNLEMRMLTRDGQWRWISASGKIVERDASGAPIRLIGTNLDVTERKLAADSLAEKEQKYRDLYENAPNAYFSTGVDGLIRRCNRRAGELLGYEAETLAGRSVMELYADTPHGKEKAARVLERFRAGEPVRDEELQMVRADGSLRWISLTVDAVHDAEGRVVESHSMAMDITERKQAEERIRDSEVRFRTLFEGVADALLIADIETGLICDANTSAIRLFGRPRNELLGMHQSALHPASIGPHTRESFREHAARARSGAQSGPFEHVVLRSDGSEVPVEVMTQPVTLGGKIMIQGVFRDITDRRRTEEELRRSELKYRKLFSEMLSGFALHEIICDESGKAVDYVTLEVNRAFETLLNVKGEQVVGRRVSEFLSPEELDHWLGIFGPVALTGKSARYELHSPSSQKEFEGIVYCPERGKFAVTFLDITERKRSDEALRRFTEELEQRVKDRTAELEQKNQELERMNKLFIGREHRMAELKDKIRELENGKK